MSNIDRFANSNEGVGYDSADGSDLVLFGGGKALSELDSARAMVPPHLLSHAANRLEASGHISAERARAIREEATSELAGPAALVGAVDTSAPETEVYPAAGDDEHGAFAPPLVIGGESGAGRGFTDAATLDDIAAHQDEMSLAS